MTPHTKTSNPIKKWAKDLNRLLQGRYKRAHRHMKKMLNITREMQIKTTVRYHYILMRMTIINKSKNKCWRGCGEKGTLVPCW